MSEEKDKALLTAVKKLKIETPEELEKLVSGRMPSDPVIKETISKFPRISLFFGESGKGEVSYRTWRYEVNCLLQEKAYTKEGILLGIRRSLRGEAADMVMRLGEKASIEDNLENFQATFGNTETAETVLRKLYGCVQEPDESVVKYASRVEELFSQAVDLDAVRRSQQVLLKSIFYEGLRTEVKVASAYKYEAITDYNHLKAEIRKLETELQKSKLGKPESKTKCGSAAKSEGNNEQNSDISEVKSLLQQLNSRIDKLEKEHEQVVTGLGQQQANVDNANQPGFVYTGRGARGQRHFRGNFLGKVHRIPDLTEGKGVGRHHIHQEGLQ